MDPFRVKFDRGGFRVLSLVQALVDRGLKHYTGQSNPNRYRSPRFVLFLSHFVKIS